MINKSIVSILSHYVPSLTLTDFVEVCDHLNNGATFIEAISQSNNLQAKIFSEKNPQWFQYATDRYWQYHEQGVDFIFPGHANYPEGFTWLERPPICLSVMGNSKILTDPCISVVGTREPNQVSIQWIEQELRRFLSQRKAVLVSGGARGIDQAAHFAAIRNSNPTVVVVPAGLKKLYPNNLNEWKSLVLESGGCLVSEYSPLTEMLKSRFEQRNRLIAQLGSILLIVEGKLRSGTMLTAKQAILQSKTMGVVPAHPMQIGFSGNLSLLDLGAIPIRDALDLQVLFDRNCH